MNQTGLLANLVNKGELPQVDFNVTMDNETIIKICVGALLTVVLILLVNRLLQKM